MRSPCSRGPLLDAFAAALVAMAIPVCASAQEPAPGRAGPDQSVSELRSVGLGWRGGQLHGDGPDYKATFAHEVEFTPALGRAAPHNLPFGYRLLEVGRGDATTPVEAVGPSAVGEQVSYLHADVAARYQLRGDGIEQDFVFSRLPAGRGDLVVRGRVRTALPVASMAADHVDFAIDGIGGVRVGAVLGVDARGRRAVGALHLRGDVLEYRLPAAFVDDAALPLVVDPLISTIAGITTINPDSKPDVAYDVGSDTWLIVWAREFSVSNSDIRGQRVLGSGALQGGLLSIESSASTIAVTPSVANVAMRDAFVVAWCNTQFGSSPGIHARGVLGATGAMTAAVVVQSGAGHVNPALGGEANESADDDALCVWVDDNSGFAQWCQLSYTAVDTIGVFGNASITDILFPGSSRVGISPTGGDVGRHLLVWSTGGTAPAAAVRAVDRNQNVVSNSLGLMTGVNPTLPLWTGDVFVMTGVDGDGVTWTVAFTKEEYTGTPTPSTAEVFLTAVHLTGGEVKKSTTISVPQQAVGLNRNPSTCWLRDSSLVAWGAGPDLRLTSLDSVSCSVCEGSYLVDTSANDVGFSSMSWRSVAGGDEALLVWEATNPGGQIRFVRFRADDGTIDTVMSACDGGGRLDASCAFPSHPMRFQLYDAPPNAPSLLVFSLDRLDYGCGSCTLVPDPFAGFVGNLANTNSLGGRQFDLVLPSSASGRRFYAQYATAGTGCLSGFSLSSALSIRIQ